MYANPLQAYQSVEQTTLPGPEAEAAVLTKAALKLKACRDNWNAPDGSSRLDEALKFNQLLWSILQTELSNEDNPLPRDIRVNLLRLSGFIDRRIFDIMAYPAPEKLDILIAINRNIAAGLRENPNAA